MTGFPSKRSIGTFVSAATIIPSAFAISSAVSTFFAPLEPRVSTLIWYPSSSALRSRASAAMYVCAIPVGHPVTASTNGTLVSTSVCSFSSSGSFSAISMTFLNSSTVSASRSFPVKSGSINNTDKWLSTSKCTLSAVSGAAIRKNRFAGSPSRESNSTPFGTTIAARPA